MKTWVVLMCVLVVWGSFLVAAEAEKGLLSAYATIMDSTEASIAPLSSNPLANNLRHEYEEWTRLAKRSNNVPDSESWNTELESFNANTARVLTRVFTQWLKEAKEADDDANKFIRCYYAISKAANIQKFFNEIRSKESPKSDKQFTYHKALSNEVEDAGSLQASLKSAEESLKSISKRPNLLKSSERKLGEGALRKNFLDLKKRLEVAYPKRQLKEEFSNLLKVVKNLNEEDYAQLKELEKNPDIPADAGNKILQGLRNKWEVAEDKFNPRDFPFERLNYDDLEDEVLFIYFPLLHAHKHGSPHYVAQLLSLIKKSYLAGGDHVNHENTNTSSSVAVDDDLFYDVIIPHVLLAYSQDDIDKAEEFVDVTEILSYRLYDGDNGREYWPDKYREYLEYIKEYESSRAVTIPMGNVAINVVPPIPYSRAIQKFRKVYHNIHDLDYFCDTLILKLARSDYFKLSGLVDKLQSYDEW